MAGNPSRRHRPSPKSHACPPDRKGEVSSASAGVSILADTIGVVDGRLVAGTKNRPPGIRRATLPRQSRRGPNERRSTCAWVKRGRTAGPGFDFLPVLKGGDSYTVRLNEGLRFGGFPFHRRPRCGRLAPTPVLRRLHGRLTTRRVPPRQGCSRPRSSHGRAGHRT